MRRECASTSLRRSCRRRWLPSGRSTGRSARSATASWCWRGQPIPRQAAASSPASARHACAYYLTAWKLGRYYRTYPAYVEDEVKAALDDPAQFERGPRSTKRGTATDDGPAFVVEDGRYISARWPGDAYLFGRRFADRV
jgi:hypothetical protein